VILRDPAARTLALLGWAAHLAAFPWMRLRRERVWRVLPHLVRLALGIRRAHEPRRRAGHARRRPRTLRNRTLAFGFVTAISNAQAIIFITSIFAAAGVLNANLLTGFAAILVILVLNAGYLSLIALAVPARDRPRRSMRGSRRVLDGADRRAVHWSSARACCIRELLR